VTATENLFFEELTEIAAMAQTLVPSPARRKNTMSTEQNQNRPTLQDIVRLAHEVDVQCTGNTHNPTAFDLERHEPHMAGTYLNTQAGLDAAYGDLVRYRFQLEQMGLGPTTDKETK
jgi:hypothetical protein